MKKTALLIGFHYPSSGHYRSLNSAMIDVYLVHNHCESAGFHTKIMGDFCTGSYSKTFNRAIINGYVDVDVLDFCGEKESYIMTVHDRSAFKTALQASLVDVGERLLVYFSGPGDPKGKKMIIPDNSEFSWKKWYRRIVTSVPPTTEFCFGLDCCHPPTFDLPYELREKRFRAKKLCEISLAPPLVVAFVSSETKKSADASDNGSLFTRFLLQRWGMLDRDHHTSIEIASIKTFVDQSIQKMQKKRNTQQMCVYASQPILSFLQPWIWCMERST